MNTPSPYLPAATLTETVAGQATPSAMEILCTRSTLASALTARTNQRSGLHPPTVALLSDPRR